MTKEEIQEKIESIEAIYASYFEQLSQLVKKQDEIIAEFSQALKNQKLEELKQHIASL